MSKSWMVTPQMREEHFDYYGYMVEDSKILKWYKKRYSSKAKSKKERRDEYKNTKWMDEKYV